MLTWPGHPWHYPWSWAVGQAICMQRFCTRSMHLTYQITLDGHLTSTWSPKSIQRSVVIIVGDSTRCCWVGTLYAAIGGMRRQSKGNPNQIEIYESTDVCLGQSEYESFLSCYCWSGCLLLAIFTIRPDRHLASIFHFVSSIIVRPGFAGVKEALCRSGKTQNSA